MAQSANNNTRSVTVAFTGDLVPSRAMFEGDQPIDPAMSDVHDLFASADVAIPSLLSPLNDR